MTETIADLETTSEDGDFIQTADFFQPKGFAPDHLPGVYRQEKRLITYKRKDDGNIVFEMSVPLPRANGTFSQYPYKFWASTKTFEAFGGKGRTSGVAQYLDACGIDPKGLRKNDVIDLVLGTSEQPLGVEISWRDKYSERSDAEKLNKKDLKKAKDFKLPDGTFQHQVIDEASRVWTGESFVRGFVPLSKVKE